jgi:hypothetical protein
MLWEIALYPLLTVSFAPDKTRLGSQANPLGLEP